MSAAVRDQLRRFVDDSVLRRNTYWRLFYAYQWYNNLLSIPLLLASSMTGLGSVSQASLGAQTSPLVLWATAALGTASTFLAALQRTLRYGERAEHCRNLAKAYGDLAKRIEITLDVSEDGVEPVDLAAFVREVVQEFRQLVHETQDMPPDMLVRERSHQAPEPEPLRVALLPP
jgi:hypothetical protein